MTERIIQRGWTAANTIARQDYSSLDIPTATEDGRQHRLIKFLEPEPFYSGRFHWSLDGLVECAERCPFCERNIPAKPIAYHSVAVLSVGAKPQLRYLAANGLMQVQIDNITAMKPKGDWYFAIGHNGKSKRSSTFLFPQQPEDVLEDWGVSPLTGDDIAELGVFQGNPNRVMSRSAIESAAEEMADIRGRQRTPKAAPVVKKSRAEIVAEATKKAASR